MTTTKEIVQQMMTTRTGRSILDSGGTPQYNAAGEYTGSTSGYGRNWERNQGKNFDLTPEAVVTGEYDNIYFVRSVYHWMLNVLEYAEDADEFFCKWQEDEERMWADGVYAWGNGYRIERDPKYRSYLEDVEAFCGWLGSLGVKYNSGLYGEGSVGGVGSVNSYNGEDNLSQVVQISYIYIEDVPDELDDVLECGNLLLFVQLHQGCDVRGGYTRPHIFTPNLNYSEVGWLCFSDGSIYCPECHTRWTTDYTYHWYEEGSTGPVCLTPELQAQAWKLSYNTKQKIDEVVAQIVTECWEELSEEAKEMLEEGIAPSYPQALWDGDVRYITPDKDEAVTTQVGFLAKKHANEKAEVIEAMQAVEEANAKVQYRPSVELQDLRILDIEDEMEAPYMEGFKPLDPTSDQQMALLEDAPKTPPVEQQIWKKIQAEWFANEGTPVLISLEDRHLVCPMCGRGVLEACMF